MKKCIVIGGGFAGLTSAAYLSKAGIKVELLEASPKLGGRAYSFIDKDSGVIVDNGQHIMMGCYKNTLKFFKLIKADSNLIYQKKLKVIFLKENFNKVPLETITTFYPLNLILAVLNFKAVSFNNRLRLLRFFIKLPFVNPVRLKNKSVIEWLEEEGQNGLVKKAFWEILAVSALNTNIRKASAEMFYYILKEIFLKGNNSAAIVLPKYGLSETYCEASKNFIEKCGGRINLSEMVSEIKFNEGEAVEIITDRRNISEFDYLISAVQLSALNNIRTGINFTQGLELSYSSILSVHVWLKENDFNDRFYGLINSKLHWIFNHDDHITLVISDADRYIDKTKEEIFELIFTELTKFTGLKRDNIISYKVIKEKRATFIPDVSVLSKRPNVKTKFKNFYIAGDWVDTGLPSTIESAVKSGRIAANKIIDELNSE